MGGENFPHRLSQRCVRGSSPRGRGKRLDRRRTVVQGRLIPAWAGKTTATYSPKSSDPAHPRVGGANVEQGRYDARQRGSSPRGRGKRLRTTQERGWLRLIPAWAGKTRVTPSLGPALRAHPRVGGENDRVAGSSERRMGSSPRGRGKRAARDSDGTQTGLIPAWAGKTPSGLALMSRLAAHPRVGGENRPGVVQGLEGEGSSPRGRGKPNRPHHARNRPRLIPAWSGKTVLHRS